LAAPAAKKRLIWYKDHWEALPSGLISAIKTPLFTVGDKLKVLKEPFVKKGDNPHENLKEMVYRRLGKSFHDYAIDPFISGVYAGDTGYLIPKYALPKLYNLEQKYGSFIRGAIKKKQEISKEEKEKVTKQIFSTAKGLQGLTDTLTRLIGAEHIKYNCNPYQIDKQGELYIIENETFTHVFSTINAKQISRTFQFISDRDTKYISNLKYAKIVEVAVGFNKWEGIKLEAFGGLIPGVEHKDLLGVLFMSTLFKNRAPKDGALLAIFLGGIKKASLTELSDEAIKKLVGNALKEMFKLNNFKPDLFEISRYSAAIAQYGLDSKQRLADLKHLEKQHKNLYLGGSMLDGVGIPDRIKQAVQIATKIINSDES
jgi:oxygen-dependent protoporphyrinogen oxidase